MAAEFDLSNMRGWALLSGGKDSTLAALEMQSIDRLEGVVYIDTGVGLSETFEYVKSLSNSFNWKLEVTKGYTSYDDFVIRNGFPTPYGHSQIMHVIKLDAIRRFISRKKKEFGSTPLLFSGVRKAESNRRSRWSKQFQKYQGAWWECPIYSYEDETVWQLLKEYRVPLNPAYSTIGKSGDCLCGSFSNLAEKRVIHKYYPYLANKIADLEKRTQSKNHGIWGNTDKQFCSMENLEDEDSLVCQACMSGHL